MEESREKVKIVLDNCFEKGITDWSTIKSQIRDTLGKFLYEKQRGDFHDYTYYHGGLNLISLIMIEV